jgi:hypothetical protein
MNYSETKTENIKKIAERTYKIDKLYMNLYWILHDEVLGRLKRFKRYKEFEHIIEKQISTQEDLVFDFWYYLEDKIKANEK